MYLFYIEFDFFKINSTCLYLQTLTIHRCFTLICAKGSVKQEPGLPSHSALCNNNHMK